MSCCWRLVVCLLLLAGMNACQPRETTGGTVGAEAAAAMPPAAAGLRHEATVSTIDWAAARNCRDMLGILQNALARGRIDGLDDTPFLLIGDGAATLRGRRPRASTGTAADIGAGSADAEARCVLRVGPAEDVSSDHRVLGREQVRSRYQSGTRREKNPAYDVAKARLRQAEKAAKPGKPSIIKVGDPLIDLVGTLVGGALTGLGQWGAGDQLEEALDELTATPASIEHPVYRDYHFERARVRASRQATLPVTLTDRWLQQSWRTTLKRQESRELTVVTGLDREDEHHARHRENSVTEDGLRQWLAEAPALPLADMVEVLLDRPSTAPLDRLALADAPGDRGDRPVGPDDWLEDASLDAAALPPRHRLRPTIARSGLAAGRLHDGADRPSAEGASSASLITLIGEQTRAEGVYVAPHFILAPSEVIGERGLIDLEDSPGRRTLGLVAAVDRSLGLALIHAPTAGRPITLGAEADAAASRHSARDSASDASSPDRRRAAPLLAGEKLVGFSVAHGPAIDVHSIQRFLEGQQHLLPLDR